MIKDGDLWEMQMPALGKKEIVLDNTLKPDSNSDTPETDWIVEHYSEDGIGELIKKCRQLERRLSLALTVIDAKETRIKNLIANTGYKWASKEALERTKHK